MDIIDARQGAQDHACSGVWHYNGLNRGGHETYVCDALLHGLIGAHVSADHRCQDARCAYVPVSQASAPALADAELVERMARAARNARDADMPGSGHKAWEALDQGAQDRWRNAIRAALAEMGWATP